MLSKNSLRLLKFALDYRGWQSYGNDRSTKSAVKNLANHGLIETNEYRQFQLRKPKVDSTHLSNLEIVAFAARVEPEILLGIFLKCDEDYFDNAEPDIIRKICRCAMSGVFDNTYYVVIEPYEKKDIDLDIETRLLNKIFKEDDVVVTPYKKVFVLHSNNQDVESVNGVLKSAGYHAVVWAWEEWNGA